MPSLQQPFSLANMSTLANSGEDRQAAPMPEVPKVPSSLMSLPPRK